MSKRSSRYIPLIFLAAVLLLSGCSTLAVKFPKGMFVSTGDYVKGVRTIGILQENKTVIAPLFLIDINKVHEELFKKLIAKADSIGAEGVTNITFSWKPSPFSYLSLPFFTIVLDFYIEGVAIDTP
ncbi:MAG: hypothetical protein GXP33_09080 [Spirochaetes bacterium]|nr:hypothetical protein [Spirochaetota bacterium]